MADPTIQLEDYAVATTYNLVTGDLQVVLGSWRESARAGRTIITVQLVSELNATEAEIRTAHTAIVNLLDTAVLWHKEASKTDSVWLRYYTDGESARRALVYSYALEPVDSQGYSPHLRRNRALFVLTMTIDGEYEEVTDDTQSETGVHWLGDTFAIDSALYGGSADGRVKLMQVEDTDGTKTFARFWCGILPNELTDGTRTAFDPLFDSTDGDLDGTVGDSEQSVTGAHGGTAARIVFSSAGGGLGNSLGSRISWSISDATSYRGKYVVLLRCSADSGTSIGARVATAHMNLVGFSRSATTPVKTNRVVYMDGGGSTVFYFLELGEIEIPPTPARYAVTDEITTIRSYIAIDAERTDGSGYLYIDAIVLIPSSHMVRWETWTALTPTTIYVITDEDGATTPFAESGGILSGTGTLDVTNWRMPKSGGIFVFAADSVANGPGETTDSAAIDLETRLRWKHYQV